MVFSLSRWTGVDMRVSSQVLIHMGVNFVVAPAVERNQKRGIKLQQALLERGLEFTHSELSNRVIAVTRRQPNLQIRTIAPEDQPVAQLIIVAAPPDNPCEMFSKEAQAAVEAFEATWPDQQRQVIRSDATVRALYETETTHAFQQLWESRLGQSAESLKPLGFPILGGGLRFVIPPPNDPEDSVLTEVKIESFLQNSSQVFVEVQLTWSVPMPAGRSPDPEASIGRVVNYIDKSVVPFLAGEGESDD
jgi:hypothetical protein